MTYRIQNVSQPFDVEGVAKCLYCQFISDDITASLAMLNDTQPGHAPWVCVGGGESSAPVTPVHDIVFETRDAIEFWPAPGTEGVPVATE